MFDPTIFENLKVAFENHMYDLDNIEGIILITNRIDRLEMADMSRQFALQFTLVDQQDVKAEIQLEASLKDLAAEILEIEGENPGCSLFVRFYVQVEKINVSTQCAKIQEIVQEIWTPDLPPTQTLSFVYGQEQVYRNTIEVTFNRKISEDQMGDIPNLLEHMLRTLNELSAI